MKQFAEIEGEFFEIEINDDHSLSINGEVLRYNAERGNRPEHLSLILEGKSHQVWVEPLKTVKVGQPPQMRVHLHGFDYEVVYEDRHSHDLRKYSAVHSSEADLGMLLAPMPGLVLKVLVDVGMRVNKGDGVVIVEAMKMENEIRSPHTGEVKSIHVTPKQTVEKGEVLAVIG